MNAETTTTSSVGKRIAVFVDGDRAWSLPAWVEAIPLLKTQHTIVGLWQFPQRFGKRKGVQIPLWYLRTFGLSAFLIFGIYSVLISLRNATKKMSTFRALACKHGIPYFESNSPNDDHVVQWVRTHDIDIVVIMIGHICKQPLLTSARLGFINKHAACLPSCRGMFPFFWAKLRGEPLGVSFHVVDEHIDEGPILLQRRYCPKYPDEEQTMLRFYKDVFHAYPSLLKKAIDLLIQGSLESNVYPGTATYYSFPGPSDAQEFRARGFSAAKLSDLIYAPHSERFV